MTEVVGDTNRLLASFEETWLDRAKGHVESSPQAHLAEMLRVALKTGVLRPVDGRVSDGFHTFDELYRHRMLLNAALFRDMEIRDLVRSPGDQFLAHKSRFHSDGAEPFDDPGWFIVVAQLPTGQISYHYEAEHWDLFKIPERDRAAEWDGHTADQAADRLQEWLEG